MKTRRQLREEQAKKAAQKSTQRKQTKAQVMKQKQAKQKQLKGKSVGAKRQKAQLSVQVNKQVKNDSVRVSVKAIKKQKQARVKVSPKGRTTRQTTKRQTRVEASVEVKRKSEGKKGQRAKEDKVVDKEEVKPQPPAEQLPRKKPDTNDNNNQPAKQQVKTLIMKGKTPIDQYFPLRKQDYHVLQQSNKIYSATLNQTNVQNNNNKFYVLQILQSDTNAGSCYFFTRWGRVGVPGQKSTMGPMSVVQAINDYNMKYRQKTRKGEYIEVEMNYADQQQQQHKKKADQQQAQKKKSNNIPSIQQKQKKQSTLPKPVQSLIQLIFDLSMMNKQMFQIGFNVNKMPLGKLSKQSIKKGYNILKQLAEQLKDRRRNNEIVRLTNEFYSNIPHDFGFTKMSAHVLDTQTKVKTKIEMLQSLAEIKVATTLINQGKLNQHVNKLDANYAKLNRNIQPIDKSSTQFKTINDYLQSTHGRHHTSYTLELVDLFSIKSQMETVRYTEGIHNKKLLWHGSRLTNFVGILSQGLRIAPPEAPVTGYMFGKGVYFADMSSKSANYCFTSRQNNTGILLLCQVACGNMNEKTHADYYAANLPQNKHSTKGVGKIQPDPKNAVQLQKGVEIPMGPGVESNDPSLYLRYNQFIVYDIAQVKIKYLLRLKFNYTNNFGFGF